jgi:hypothetical protein
MLRRLQASSLNLLVLGTSAAIFIIAYFVLQGMAAARIPQSTQILTAANSLQIGDLVQAVDLIETTVFIDEMTEKYVDTADAGQIVGAYAALPIHAGQPILRENLIAPDSGMARFSALLSQFPGHSLFPLPLDISNVVAPPLAVYQPGDLVGLTVVIRNRPQPPATPTPESFAFSIPGIKPTELPTLLPQPTAETDQAIDRSFPPLAKDIFPQGVRVVSIEGLPKPIGPDGEAPAFNNFNEKEMLILLLPETGRELLSLAIQQGDRVFVSLLSHNTAGSPTDGFTYWDFEAWFLEDRSEETQP